MQKGIKRDYSLTMYSLALGGSGFMPLRVLVFLMMSNSMLSGTGE